MLIEAIKLAGEAIKFVKETEKDREARVERERKEQEQQQLKNQQALQKGRAATAQANLGCLDAMKIEQELEKIDLKLENVEQVVERVRKILDQPGNESLKTDFERRLNKSSKDPQNRIDEESLKSGSKQTATEQEIKQNTQTNQREIEALKQNVDGMQSRSFFTRRFLEAAASTFKELEKDEHLLSDSKLPAIVAQQKEEVQRAMSELDETDGRLNKFKNSFMRIDREQKEVTEDKPAVA